MIRAQLQILHHPGMDAAFVDRPGQPLAGVGAQVNVRQAIDQG